MNILFPPEMLASYGFVFQTHQETSAFSDLLAEELIQRLNREGTKVEGVEDIKELYNTDPEWKDMFFKNCKGTAKRDR